MAVRFDCAVRCVPGPFDPSAGHSTRRKRRKKNYRSTPKKTLHMFLRREDASIRPKENRIGRGKVCVCVFVCGWRFPNELLKPLSVYSQISLEAGGSRSTAKSIEFLENLVCGKKQDPSATPIRNWRWSFESLVKFVCAAFG